jgi:hypothetical protein
MGTEVRVITRRFPCGHLERNLVVKSNNNFVRRSSFREDRGRRKVRNTTKYREYKAKSPEVLQAFCVKKPFCCEPVRKYT